MSTGRPLIWNLYRNYNCGSAVHGLRPGLVVEPQNREAAKVSGSEDMDMDATAGKEEHEQDTEQYGKDQTSLW